MKKIFILIIVSIGLLFSGCNKQPQKQSNNAAAAKIQQVILPDWAPKHPSSEFLRAAKILKPFPMESYANSGNHLMDQTFNAKFNAVLVPAWEFFGTLSDEQTSKLFNSKEIVLHKSVDPKFAKVNRARLLNLPIKSMTAKQQAALKRYLKLYGETFKGFGHNGPDGNWDEDKLILLYKLGAKEDLSNVLCSIMVRGNRLVRMNMYVVKSDGSFGRSVGVVFGYS
jgi:hypothetical protein